jgi:hypothetical protein
MPTYRPWIKLNPPDYVAEAADKLRWHLIDRQRMRAGRWWAAAATLRTVGWMLAIGTVIVAGITAGRPGFINWTDGTIRNWSTAVAILSGLSGLIPWREVGRAFTRAHQILVDVITRYDADPKYTVEQMLNGSREAEKELLPGDYKPARPPANADSRKRFLIHRTKRPAPADDQ